MTPDLAHPCPVCAALAGEPCSIPYMPLCANGVHVERLNDENLNGAAAPRGVEMNVIDMVKMATPVDAVRRFLLPNTAILSAHMNANGTISAQIELTPAQAAAWTSVGENPRNTVSRRVADYAATFARGGYQTDAGTFHIDINGHLLNGWHRSRALIKANVTVVADVRFMCQPTLVDCLDVCNSRTVGQIIKIGGVENANKTASVVKEALTLERGFQSINATVADTKDAIHRYDVALRCLMKVNPSERGVACGAVLGALTYAYPTCPNVVEQIAEKLHTGAIANPNDPVLRLRRALITKNGGSSGTVNRCWQRSITLNTVVASLDRREFKGPPKPWAEAAKRRIDSLRASSGWTVPSVEHDDSILCLSTTMEE